MASRFFFLYAATRASISANFASRSTSSAFFSRSTLWPLGGLLACLGAAFRLLFDTPCSFSKRATFFGETEALRQTLPTFSGENAEFDANAESLPVANPAFIDAISAALRVNHSDAARRAAFISLFFSLSLLCPLTVTMSVEEEIDRLKKRLKELELRRDAGAGANETNNAQCTPGCFSTEPWDRVAHGLSKETIERFSRQIILPSFGVRSQSKLHNGSVLVVGAGGLGSPALLYLAAAGVGRIGIVDRDAVELSNIHRQVVHRECSVGVHKTASARESLLALNSTTRIEEHTDGFSPVNALELVRMYDVVLDASDNAPTRYLISDACCVANKPLVSGAAIGTDGQLTVYHHGDDGPCYRCLYPTPPPAASCSRCADAGVLGPVPGIIGTMEALEAIKILTGIGDVMSKKMLVMDALYCRYMVVKLRSRNEGCVACGAHPELTAESLPRFDYDSFTGQAPSDAPTGLTLVDNAERIRAGELQAGKKKRLLLDVRPAHQFDICSIPGAYNVPMSSFDANEVVKMARDGEYEEVVVICRRGNQSQRALLALKAAGLGDAVGDAPVVDVMGGMTGWSREVDGSCPIY